MAAQDVVGFLSSDGNVIQLGGRMFFSPGGFDTTVEDQFLQSQDRSIAEQMSWANNHEMKLHFERICSDPHLASVRDDIKALLDRWNWVIDIVDKHHHAGDYPDNKYMLEILFYGAAIPKRVRLKSPADLFRICRPQDFPTPANGTVARPPSGAVNPRADENTVHPLQAVSADKVPETLALFQGPSCTVVGNEEEEDGINVVLITTGESEDGEQSPEPTLQG